MKTIFIIFFSLVATSLFSQDAIPTQNGRKSKFTNSYKYYRIVTDNSDTNWLTLKNEFTFNVGRNYNIKMTDAFGRSETYICRGETEEFIYGNKKGWKNYYALANIGNFEFNILRAGLIIKKADLIAVYTNVPSFFPDDFFY